MSTPADHATPTHQDSGERLAVKLLRELVALDAACAGSHLAVAPLEAKIDEARDFLAALTATHPPEVETGYSMVGMDERVAGQPLTEREGGE